MRINAPDSCPHKQQIFLKYVSIIQSGLIEADVYKQVKK